MYKSIDKKIVFSTEFFKIQESSIEDPHGNITSPWYRFLINDFVIVVPVTESGEVVMVRQYRNGSESLSLELPAGGVDPGESFEEAARRELLEETGYGCSRLAPIGQEMYSNPSTHSNKCQMFLAEGCYKIGEQNLDPFENIEVVTNSFEEVVKSVFDGEIVSIVTSFALLAGAARRGQLLFSSQQPIR